MLLHQRRDQGDLTHLMAQRMGILALKQGAAAAAGIRVVFDHLIHPFNRQQLRPCVGMTRLTAALAATALAALWWLKPRPAAGWRLAGVA